MSVIDREAARAQLVKDLIKARTNEPGLKPTEFTLWCKKLKGSTAKELRAWAKAYLNKGEGGSSKDEI